MRAVFQFSILVLVAILIFIISHPQKYLLQFFQAKKMLTAAAVILLAPSIVSATDCRLFTVGECTPSNDIWVDEVNLLSLFFLPTFTFYFLQICVDEVNVLSLFFPFTFQTSFFYKSRWSRLPCFYFLCHSLSLLKLFFYKSG